jgi:signal transduction histidine kinase
MRLTLRRTLLLGLAAALMVALIPAGLVLDRILATRLEEAARADLERAPMLLTDLNAALGDALMMHAREAANAVGLAQALASGRTDAALRLLVGVIPVGEEPVLVSRDGVNLAGPLPSDSQLAAARRGESPVDFVRSEGRLHTISVAPVALEGSFSGVAGVAKSVDAATAGTLAGLTDSDVLIVAGDSVVASTMETDQARALARAAALLPADAAVRELQLDGVTFWLTAAPLGDVARVVFSLDRSSELALVPELRRSALLALLLALGLALALGAVLAMRVTSPVRSLATAADSLSAGDFDAPLKRSRLEEVDRMSHAFARMRSALQERLAELSRANTELAERQDRLQALQSELIRRDRLTASARLVTELAHEIRNPVANVRNCLEVVHRRLADDPEGQRFADLAIDELLRMHELAEQMLDLNRPLDPAAARTDAAAVLEQVVALYRAGGGPGRKIELKAEPGVPAVAMPPDAFKQVLLNLVQNAREVMPETGTVRLVLSLQRDRAVIDVADEGPGIPRDRLDRIFDPFYSTKAEVSGVGLGLFVAQGLVTRSGGTLSVQNREGSGAVFRIELPLMEPERSVSESGHPSARKGGGYHAGN